MKITEIIQQRKFIFSCEFFPPKTEEGMPQLFETIRQTKSLDLGYISVTYGAGGGTRDKTIELVQRAKQELGVESMAHLTCVGHSKPELREILERLKQAGIENMIALRGDPPKGQAQFSAHPQGFRYAQELIEFIRGSYDFCIAAAGYPEGHPETPSKEANWEHLAAKVKSGADFVITQLFFNNADFFNFRDSLYKKGARVPVIPGIMPITNFSQILRFTQMCGAKIPQQIIADLEPIQNDLEKVQQYGVEYAARQCEELMREGVPGIHFYTLNKSKSTSEIIARLRGKT